MLFGYDISFQLMDKGNIETFGPLGLSNTFLAYTSKTSLLYSGLLSHYLFVMLLGIFWFLSLNFLYLFTAQINLIVMLLIFSYFLTINFFQGS
jgi:hypothetical protein